MFNHTHLFRFPPLSILPLPSFPFPPFLYFFFTPFFLTLQGIPWSFFFLPSFFFSFSFSFFSFSFLPNGSNQQQKIYNLSPQLHQNQNKTKQKPKKWGVNKENFSNLLKFSRPVSTLLSEKRSWGRKSWPKESMVFSLLFLV